MSLFIKNIFLVQLCLILAILYPTSLANLVVEVGTRHSHQTLLDRCNPDTVYLKHIISHWTQLQSKLHAVLHKESFGSRLAGCRGLHASLTMLLLAVSHGYILCMNFKIGDKFAVKYPFWVCATILNKYVHVYLMTSWIRWYQFQTVM